MSRAERNFAAMTGGKTQGWRYSQVKSILEWAEFTPKGQRGSDRIFKHEGTGVRVFISYHGSGRVDSVYVQEVVKAINRSKEG